VRHQNPSCKGKPLEDEKNDKKPAAELGAKLSAALGEVNEGNV
jgi:hypothetical protein